MPRITGEYALARDDLQDWLQFVVQHGVAADLVFLGSERSVRQPLLDFLSAAVVLDVRGAADDSLDGEVVLVPEPAEDEE